MEGPSGVCGDVGIDVNADGAGRRVGDRDKRFGNARQEFAPFVVDLCAGGISPRAGNGPE
ncbi:hypothetical protein ACMA1D_15490 [Streptomyces sp. 796.1]|uniref:hypothetical protein n=1 Tax=Streptomyces sp. 796.1 TaxID=3163029 RepID=UPI0039C972BB